MVKGTATITRRRKRLWQQWHHIKPIHRRTSDVPLPLRLVPIKIPLGVGRTRCSVCYWMEIQSSVLSRQTQPGIVHRSSLPN